MQKDGCEENELNIFLAPSINNGRKNHAQEKREKAGKEKIYQDGLNQTQ